MKLGSITKRGKNSWRIKIELSRDPETGERRYHLETVRGRHEDAKARLVEVHDEINKGKHIAPSALTVAEYVNSWLAAPVGISPKTLERYKQLAAQQIIPHLGQIPLQKLDTDDLQNWHGKLLASGGKGGRPLSAQTVGHAHRVLQRALNRAIAGKKLFRNVAGLKESRPPKVEQPQIEILSPQQIEDCLAKLAGHEFYPIVVAALGTGLRRGELLALQWGNVDLDGASLRVERSLEETKEGLRFKPPKSKAGRRTVSLPPSVVEVLRDHRRLQLERRVRLAMGRITDDALVFSEPDGSKMSPDKLSRDWCRLVAARKLPKISFHALRHSHVSALIAAGLDVYSVSRRIGHSDPAVTLRTYTHMFSKKDSAAAQAIEAALRPAVR
jgi:integrase